MQNDDQQTPTVGGQPQQSTDPLTAVEQQELTQLIQPEGLEQLGDTTVTLPLSPVEQEAQPTAGVAPAVAQARPWLQEQKHPQRKKLVITGILSAFLIVLISSGTAAYAFWYQNPEKALSDAMVNSLMAKTLMVNGKATIKQDKLQATVVFDGSSGYGQGSSAKTTLDAKYDKDYSVKLGLSVVVDAKGDYYFKPSGLKEAVNQATKAMNSSSASSIDGVSKETVEKLQKQYTALIDTFIAKIDNKWMVFSLDDLKDMSKETAEQYECTNKVLTRLRDDKTMLEELGKLYEKNQVVIIKRDLGIKDGAIGLAIGTDKKKEIAFVNALKETKLNKELRACYDDQKTPIDQTIYDDDDVNFESKDAPEYRTELWIDQWTHQLKRVVVTSVDSDTTKSNYNVDVQTSFNQPVSVTAPKNAKTFDELKKDIQELMQGSVEVFQSVGAKS